MNTESPSTTTTTSSTPNAGLRLFRAHVAALVFTAAVVVPLLLGTTTIPAWVSITYCIIIAAVAVGFLVAATLHVRSNRSHKVFGCNSLILALGLSMTQFIFISPVVICVYAPTLRL
ncbi:MAG: hypothetical protein O2931_02565 [Planctomycetota bacterium]|nr:hypothetical protein [Planctomycetota bacterium]MDA1177658.1 hypothetical protein [Planctomycetota bacterium]